MLLLNINNYIYTKQSNISIITIIISYKLYLIKYIILHNKNNIQYTYSYLFSNI